MITYPKYAVSAEWGNSPKSNGSKKSLFARVCNYRDHNLIEAEVKITGKYETEFISVTYDISPCYWITATYRTDIKEVSITQNFSGSTRVRSFLPLYRIFESNQFRKTTIKNFFEVVSEIQKNII